MIHSLLSRLGIETWKDIPTFEGVYQASNLGNVKSKNYRLTRKTKTLLKHKDSRGRYKLNLCKNNVETKNYISVLVARAFLNHKPCGYKLVVDHIDNNPSNDRLYNLQVITQRQNCSKDKKGSSKYSGVYWHKPSKKWRSVITINQQKKHLGHFTDEQEAAQAYQNELKKLYERSKSNS